MTPYDADECVQETVRDMLNNGDKIVSTKENSYEMLYYSTGLKNPRARIMMNPNRPLNIIVAMARFIWLASGNNRVADIAYYEPKVCGFSDDGITVPGSDYGLRIFQPRPGLNQIEGVVSRLSKDPLSRQAATVVWQPEDAVRESRDIPCTFGMFFHIRNGKLLMNVNMRSNNAFRILPFNIFEFTMLQELVATELLFDVGRYSHWAASMHVYDNEREISPTRSLAASEHYDSILMSPMPPHSMNEVKELARLESQLRHHHTETDFEVIIAQAEKILHPYWFKMFVVLACYVAAKRGYSMVPFKLVGPGIQEVLKSSLEHMMAVQ